MSGSTDVTYIKVANIAAFLVLRYKLWHPVEFYNFYPLVRYQSQAILWSHTF
ncbi:hypothetical protein DET54_104117 [Paenibacillus pabuli]|uniref:Uncharacterized protein n=1 Tax=Paenibacillus pabuli TaxID=1472 RepID=A0ABX9BLZ5_9BACL|nr:hypothetical protein DET54_104117 [Paenibacillus pabuli]